MRRLARDVLLMAVATASSRILGLVRDISIADRFGAGAAYDAFLIAFFVPHFLRQLLAEGALSTAMVPLYADLRTRSNDVLSSADAFASNLISWLLLFFPVLVAVGIWLAPTYVPFLASGFDADKMVLAVQLARIVFPFIALVGVAAVVMGVLTAHRRFFAASFAPVWFNVGMLIGILLLSARMEPPIFGVALGVLIGGAGQLASQIPALARVGFRFRFRLFPVHPQIGNLLRRMAPAVLTLAVTQVNLMVDNKLASHLNDGGISALQYGMRLFQLPLGVLAVSVATALLPRLSEAWALRDRDRYYAYVNEGIVVTALALLPAMVGLWALGPDVVRLLFEHGSFVASDTARTSQVLSYYLIGLLPYGWVYVLTRAAYAQGTTRFPLFAAMLATGINVGMDLALIGTMGAGGLALATAVSGIGNALLLGLFILSRRSLSHESALRMIWIAIGCGALYPIVRLVRHLLAGSSRLLIVAVPILAGVAFYAGFVRVSPLWNVLSALRRPDVKA
jgi:putative peptidoglycan lipid II flippase